MNEHENEGILYGVGVGPGDPGDLTLRAVRTIAQADAVVLPQAARESCRAYQIAVQAVPGLAEKRAICCHFPMTRDKAMRDKAVRTIYADLAACLRRGEKLAFLTIGDPSVYSTFGYLSRYAEEDHFRTQIISGVPSFVSCCAAAGIPLCLDEEEVHIIGSARDPEEALKLPGTKVFMKSGRKLGGLRSALAGHPECSVFAVRDAGMKTQEIWTELEDVPAAYMLTVIVK